MIDMEFNELESYEKKAQLSSEECFQKVMNKWMEGQGKSSYPVGWNGLCTLLSDAGASQVAEELKEVLEKAHKP